MASLFFTSREFPFWFCRFQIKQYEKHNVTTEELLDVLTNSSSPRAGQLLSGDLLLTVKGLEASLSKIDPRQSKTVAKVPMLS